MTELYTVDETVTVDASGTSQASLQPTPALIKTLEIGSLCNNAVYRHEEAAYVGHSVDVALLNVLPTFGMSDQRVVCAHRPFILLVVLIVITGLHSSIGAALQLGAQIHGRQWDAYP